MKNFFLKNVLLVICSVFSFAINATTIVPYTNLGEMGKASQYVVLAKAEQNLSVSEQGVTFSQTSFTVVNRIKGEIANEFRVQNLSRFYGKWERKVSGDIKFEPGSEYLMFLKELKEGVYQTKMLSHGVFIKEIIEQEAALVPVNQGLLSGNHIRTDGIELEAFAIYKKEKLISHLAEVLNSDVIWQNDLVSTKYSLSAYYGDNSKGSEPDHCYVDSAPPFSRWRNFPGEVLPVSYEASGDPSCPAASTNIQNAINTINNNYPGVILSGLNSFTGFVPVCNTGVLGDAVFDWPSYPSFINAALGGPRNIAIHFDDPCDEIDDLDGCSGTLAYGGIWSFSDTHSFAGMEWKEAGYGFVVVNNGVGDCNCSSGYEIMLVHEMTHALGFDHIPSTVGAANMNPTCCNTITPLDFDCLQYTYPSTTVASEISEFSAKKEEKGVGLFWKSLSEISMDYYILERSYDGINYNELTRLEARNSAGQYNNYQFFDSRPLNGHNYYRLTPVELNGNLGETQYSQANFFYSKEMLVYPNPTNGDFAQVRLYAEKESSYEFNILDITGKEILKQQKNVDAGMNWITLEMVNIRSGVYFLQIVNDGNIDLIRVVKSD